MIFHHTENETSIPEVGINRPEKVSVSDTQVWNPAPLDIQKILL